MLTIKDKNGLNLYQIGSKIQDNTVQVEFNNQKQIISQYQPVTQNQNLIACFTEEKLQIYDINKQQFILEHNDQNISNVYFSPTNKYLVIKYQDKKMKLYKISENLQLLVEDFSQVYSFSQQDTILFTQNKGNLDYYTIEDDQMKLQDSIQVYPKKYAVLTLESFENIICAKSLPDKQIQGFCDFYRIENNKIKRIYSFIIQQASLIDSLIQKNYAIVQIYSQFTGANYYGGKKLILVDFCRNRQLQIVKSNLNAWTLMDYQNNFGTKVLITSEKTPSLIKATYITLQQSSNTLIIRTEEIQGYKNLHINQMQSIKNVCLMRGEASMDGNLYIGIIKNNKFCLINHLKLYYITNVYLMDKYIILATQYPRYTIDNLYTIRDYMFNEIKTVQTEKLNMIQYYDQNEIQIDSQVLQKLQQTQTYQEEVEKKEDKFVPSFIAQQQKEQQQRKGNCRSSSGFF